MKQVRTVMAAVAAVVSLCIAALSAAADVTPYTADANTAVLYHLNEANGSITAVDSANGLNLTRNTTSPFYGSSGPAGLGTAAGGFPTDYTRRLRKDPLTASDISKFSLTTFTIEAWVRNPDYSSSNSCFILESRDSDSSSNKNDLIFSIISGGALRLQIDTGSTIIYPSTSSLTWEADTWYHVAVTYDTNTAAANDSTIKFYRNIVGDTEATLIGTLNNQLDLHSWTAGEQRLSLGGPTTNNTGRSLGSNALLDEVRWYNAALTEFNLGIPEPATACLIVTGALGVILKRRQKRW